jgi:hypothetical protein
MKNKKTKLLSKKKIIEAIQNTIDWETKYHTTNTDCGMAEFTESFAYGEADMDEVKQNIIREFSFHSDCQEIPDEFIESLSRDQIRLISSVTYEDSYYRRNCEIYSVGRSGETEFYLDDHITESFEALSESAKAEVIDAIGFEPKEYFIHDLGDGRWLMELCCESLWNLYQDSLKPKPEPKKPKAKRVAKTKAPVISITKCRAKEKTPRQKLIQNQRQLFNVLADVIPLKKRA